MPLWTLIDFDRQASAASVRDVIASCSEAFAHIREGQMPRRVTVSRSAHFLLDPEADPGMLQVEESRFCYLATRRPYTVEGKLLRSASDFDVAFRHSGESLFSQIVPPFGAILRTLRDGPITVATDAYGLQHIYILKTHVFVAVSSSSMLLGRVGRAALDERSVAVYSRLGHLLGDSTFFREIKKLPASSTLRLADGELKLGTYRRLPEDERIRGGRDMIAVGTAIVGDCLRSCLEAHPDAAVQLSGGIDSRLLFAAISRKTRSKLTAVTVGHSSMRDVEVATELTQRMRMKHKVVEHGPLGDPGGLRAMEFVKRASLENDLGCNPFTLGMLGRIDDQIGTLSRISGENGESARGFYYAGQRDSESVRDVQIRRLATWRIFVNLGADQRIFTREFRKFADEAAVGEVLRSFRRWRGSWLETTDRFYLEERMQRFKGVQFSDLSLKRPMLLPFFDPRFLQWAEALPVERKRNSKAVAAVIRNLDPELASMTLDSGITVDDLVREGWLGSTRRGKVLSRKVAAVVQRKLRGSSCVAAGGEFLFREACAPGGIEGLFERTRELPFIDSGFLDRMLRETNSLYATVGMLLNLEWLLEYTTEPARGGIASR